ncbi:MAG: hypothetical protein ACRD01_02595 [Terriglobales bacterium]
MPDAAEPFLPRPILAAWLIMTTRQNTSAIVSNPAHPDYNSTLQGIGFSDIHFRAWKAFLDAQGTDFAFSGAAIAAWGTALVAFARNKVAGTATPPNGYTPTICPPDPELQNIGNNRQD